MPEKLERLSREVHRAIRIAEAHDAVWEICNLSSEPASGAVTVVITMKVGLPCIWVAQGFSPHGVKALEPVTFVFPGGYPLLPPKIGLRPDFNRSLPHIQPGDSSELPEPCLCEGSLGEFIHQKGFAGVLNQLMEWLDKAALGTLIDLNQGWEPIRRDLLSDRVVADSAMLRSMVMKNRGHIYFCTRCMLKPLGKGQYIQAEVLPEQVGVNSKNFDSLFAHEAGGTGVRGAISILIWPDENVISGEYFPETVRNYASLIDRATKFGCKDIFKDVIAWIRSCGFKRITDNPVPVVVLLVARRPAAVIGTGSNLEICPYLLLISAATAKDEDTVLPMGLHHGVSRSLLMEMSGVTIEGRTPRWILAGCGSLGSKIAMHLARTGMAPSTVIDKSCLSPHNVARHALFPAIPGVIDFCLNAKAEALGNAIKGLDQNSVASFEDLVSMANDPGKIAKLLPKDSWGIVNTTASLAVREALARMGQLARIPRILEATLFAKGMVGLIAVEGPKGNPNTLDLITEAYVLMLEDGRISGLVFNSGDALSRQPVGEGCGSLTMVMTDARLSLFAASMSEAVSNWLSSALPPSGGSINLGVLGTDGMSLNWTKNEVSPSVVVPVDGDSGWQVRISSRACAKIHRDVSEWPRVETGGILVGRISEVTKTFFVADVLPAPADSKRSRFEFVLGQLGVREILSDYSQACNFSLFCLGTWHSHLQPSGPSERDLATADTVALARLAPSILVIHTPSGFKAVLAEKTTSSAH